jgi:hypothetical protein
MEKDRLPAHKELQEEANRILEHYKSVLRRGPSSRPYKKLEFLRYLVARVVAAEGSPFNQQEAALTFYRAYEVESAKWKGREPKIPKSYADVAGAVFHLRNDVWELILKPYYLSGPGKNQQMILTMPTERHEFAPVMLPRAEAIVARDRPRRVRRSSKPESISYETTEKGFAPRDEAFDWFQDRLHHYHLTLNRQGHPVWLYTVLDFSDGDAVPRAPLLLDAMDSPADNMYEWKGTILGRHFFLTIRNVNSSFDVAVELFPRQVVPHVVTGLRMNDTWQKRPESVAGSIALLTKTPIAGLEQLPIGPVPAAAHDRLTAEWERHNTIIRRLPPPSVATFPNFPEDEIALRLWDGADMRGCRTARIMVSWFPKLGSMLRSFEGALKAGARVEIVHSHPDSTFAKYRGLAVHKNAEAGRRQIGVLRQQIRDLRQFGSITLKLADIPIPLAYFQVDDLIYFSALWSYGNAVEGPWCRVPADSGFGAELVRQFSWFFDETRVGNAKSAQADPLDVTPPPIQRLAEARAEPSAAVARRSKRSADTLLDTFWAPYLDDTRPTVIVFGEPLFERTKDRTKFSRDISLNALAARASDDPTRAACFPFLTYGEALSALQLTRWLTRRGVDVDWYPCRFETPFSDLFKHKSPEDSNVIVVGTVRSNGILADYQSQRFFENEDLNDSARRNTFLFRIEKERIIKLTDPKQPVGGPWVDEVDGPIHKAWVLISRRRGIRGGVVTMIASNYGRAIDRVTKTLTDPDALDDFMIANHPLPTRWSRVLPSRFQALVSMRFLDQDGLPLKGDTIADVWFDGDGE